MAQVLLLLQHFFWPRLPKSKPVRFPLIYMHWEASQHKQEPYHNHHTDNRREQC